MLHSSRSAVFGAREIDTINDRQRITNICTLTSRFDAQLVGSIPPYVEVAMGTSRSPLETPNLLHCLELIAVAQAPLEVVKVIRSYLAAWPKERILSVQTIDGGWAPFDQNQVPSKINGIQDLRCVRDAVHRQCVALREARMVLTPELVELDEILFIATQWADSLEAPGFKTRSPQVAARAGLFALL